MHSLWNTAALHFLNERPLHHLPLVFDKIIKGEHFLDHLELRECFERKNLIDFWFVRSLASLSRIFLGIFTVESLVYGVVLEFHVGLFMTEWDLWRKNLFGKRPKMVKIGQNILKNAVLFEFYWKCLK